MDKIHRERKAPSMPAKYITGTKHSDSSANGLTKAIIGFINLSGQQAERINTMGRMVDRTKIVKDVVGFQHRIGSVEWQKGTGTKGSSDISATIKGLSVKIEVKMKDRQSDAQKAYEESITQAGGIYVIFRDFTSFVKWYVMKFGRPDLFNEALSRLQS